MEAKPFQVGVRIEHPQELITRGRYGPDPRAQVLGPASYNLQSRGDVPAHSFCMCPGGRIVASVSEPGGLCTNGMSNSRHSSRWANAALVTTLDPEAVRALGHEGPLAGVHLQRELERRFFEAGGGTYAAPAQRASDFREGRRSSGELRTSYGFGAVGARVDELLPERVRDAIAGALGRFERTIPGFAGDEGLLVGIETRSSGPIRLPRDRGTFLARGFANLYPAGEGAGYAGGTMRAAPDGARAARAAVGGARSARGSPPRDPGPSPRSSCPRCGGRADRRRGPFRDADPRRRVRRGPVRRPPERPVGTTCPCPSTLSPGTPRKDRRTRRPSAAARSPRSSSPR